MVPRLNDCPCSFCSLSQLFITASFSPLPARCLSGNQGHCYWSISTKDYAANYLEVINWKVKLAPSLSFELPGTTRMFPLHKEHIFFFCST